MGGGGWGNRLYNLYGANDVSPRIRDRGGIKRPSDVGVREAKRTAERRKRGKWIYYYYYSLEWEKYEARATARRRGLASVQYIPRPGELIDSS